MLNTDKQIRWLGRLFVLLVATQVSAEVPMTEWGTPSFEGTWDFKTATPYYVARI